MTATRNTRIAALNTAMPDVPQGAVSISFDLGGYSALEFLASSIEEQDWADAETTYTAAQFVGLLRSCKGGILLKNPAIMVGLL